MVSEAAERPPTATPPLGQSANGEAFESDDVDVDDDDDDEGMRAAPRVLRGVGVVAAAVIDDVEVDDDDDVGMGGGEELGWWVM